MSKVQITIELPESFGFTRSGIAFNVGAHEVPVAMWAELAMHGAIQKIGDAAAGKDGDAAKEAMDAVYSRLMAGEWTGRKAGGTADEHAAYRKHIRDILRPAVKARDGKATVETIDAAFDQLEGDKLAAVIKTAKARHEAEQSLTVDIEL